MPALPRQQAAATLGISVSRLRRLTADGTGKVQQGHRGRGCATLYDVATVAELLPTSAGKKRRRRSGDVVEQLRLGALAVTLSAALAEMLTRLERADELDMFSVPTHRRTALIGYFRSRIANCIIQHSRKTNGSR